MSSEAAGMRVLSMIQSRIASGDRVRFYNDFYGGQWIELRPRWQFWRKTRLRLDAAEAYALKARLRERGQSLQ